MYPPFDVIGFVRVPKVTSFFNELKIEFTNGTYDIGYYEPHACLEELERTGIFRYIPNNTSPTYRSHIDNKEYEKAKECTRAIPMAQIAKMSFGNNPLK